MSTPAARTKPGQHIIAGSSVEIGILSPILPILLVENQIALGDETPARATVARLIREGLDRHDAIHAVGSVLAGFMNALLGGDDAAGFDNEGYSQELKALKAAEWLESFR